VQRTRTANGETYLENICDEPSCEIVYRKLGAETDIERVVALRTHPLQIEFHQRNKATVSGRSGICRSLFRDVLPPFQGRDAPRLASPTFCFLVFDGHCWSAE